MPIIESNEQNFGEASARIAMEMHDDLLRSVRSDGSTQLGETWMRRSFDRRWDDTFGTPRNDAVRGVKEAARFNVLGFCDKFTAPYIQSGHYSYHYPRNAEEQRGKTIRRGDLTLHTPQFDYSQPVAPQPTAQVPVPPPQNPQAQGRVLRHFRVMVDDREVHQAQEVPLPEIRPAAFALAVQGAPLSDETVAAINEAFGPHVEVNAIRADMRENSLHLDMTVTPPRPAAEINFTSHVHVADLNVPYQVLEDNLQQPQNSNPFANLPTPSENSYIGRNFAVNNLHGSGVISGVFTRTRMEFLRQSVPLPTSIENVLQRLQFNAREAGAPLEYMAGEDNNRIHRDATSIYNELRTAIEGSGRYMPSETEAQRIGIRQAVTDRKTDAAALLTLRRRFGADPVHTARLEQAKARTLAEFQRQGVRRDATISQVYNVFYQNCVGEGVSDDYISHKLQPMRSEAQALFQRVQVEVTKNRFGTNEITLSRLEHSFNKTVDWMGKEVNAPSKQDLEAMFTFCFRTEGGEVKELDSRVLPHFVSLLVKATTSMFGKLGKPRDVKRIAHEVVEQVGKDIVNRAGEFGEGMGRTEAVHLRLVELAATRGVSPLFQDRQEVLWDALVRLVGLPAVEAYCGHYNLKLKPHGKRVNRLTQEQVSARLTQTRRSIKL